MCQTSLKSSTLSEAAGFVILILLGPFTDASAQLPPPVLADQYLMRAEQLFAKKDYDGALSFLDKITALQKEHGFALRDEFHFKRAKIAYAAGLIPTAIEAVSACLSTGNEGEFYKDALALLIEAEEEMQENEITPANTCGGKAKGDSCWMALADRPECYVWNPYLQPDEIVTWSATCAGKTAQGEGTLTWAVADGDSSKVIRTSTGRLRYGKFDGHWVIRHKSVHGGSWEYEVHYENARKQGNWVMRNPDGRITFEGTYVDDVEHGIFVWRSFHQGRMIEGSKGEYVHGKSEGTWLYYYPEWKTCHSRVFRQGQEISEKKEVSLENCQREAW